MEVFMKKGIFAGFASGTMKRSTRKKVMAAAGLMALASANANAATTIDDGSFQDFYDAMVSWIQGSLGYVIALLGMIGTLIVYAFTHKGAVLFIGMLLSFFVGGVVGISQTMFNLGAGTFAS
jgi:hypothetical protein